MNEIPNGPDMIGEFLGERERLADQPTAPLADGIVQPFDQTRFPTGFVHRLVPFRGEDTGIDLKEIGEADSPLTVFGWEGVPQVVCRLLISWADSAPDHQAGLGINGPPQPDLVRLAADK